MQALKTRAVNHNADSDSSSKISLRLYVLIGFVPLCILYYFARFQFDIDFIILSAYAVLQITIFLIVFFDFLRLSSRQLNSLDVAVLILLLHTLYLILFTLMRSPSIDAIQYALKDYLFPVLLYWYCRNLTSRMEWLLLWKIVAIVMTVASLIYIAEFYDRIILANGPFAYTEKVRALTMEVTGSDELSGTVIKGDIYTLVRFEGPLSHNNVTGLAMALGALLSFMFAVGINNRMFLVAGIVNVVGLLVAAPRTAIFSALVSWFVFLLLGKGAYRHVFGNAKNIALFVFIVLAVFMISVFMIDFSAYLIIISFESIFNTLFLMLANNSEFDDLIHLFANPLNWLGAGFPVPGFYDSDFNVVRSDDLFFVQLISMYGIIGVAILIFCVKLLFRRSLFRCSQVNGQIHLVFKLGFVIVVAMLVSTIHTNALVRPQLYPIFFIGLAAISYYFDSINFARQEAARFLK